MTDPAEPLSPDLEAAEYALGIQSAEARAIAERRLTSDPAFAEDVAAWNERLAPMLDDLPSVRPPRVVWLRILAQLGAQPVAASARSGPWHSVVVWRTAAFASTAAAAVLAFAVLIPGTAPPAPVVERPATGATLTAVGLLKPDADGPTSFVITFDRASERLIIAPVAGASPSDRSYELWMLPDGTPPVSMGVLDGTGVVTLDARRLVGANGETLALAISLEPLGGSPTGSPTGPVIASGQMQPV